MFPVYWAKPTPRRHRYYWFTERRHYIDWVSALGRAESKSHMLTYYEPIWREMEPVLLRMEAETSNAETGPGRKGDVTEATGKTGTE